MKRLQICMFDSDLYLKQVWILHLDVKIENVQLQKSTCSNLKKMTFTRSKMTFYLKSNVFYIYYVGVVSLDRSPSSGSQVRTGWDTSPALLAP